MRYFREIAESLGHLFFPARCAVCGTPLSVGEALFCTRCRWEIPLTGFWDHRDNPVRDKLFNLTEVAEAVSFFHYRKNSGYDTLIHQFKYGGKPALAFHLGQWFGEELKRTGRYEEIDCVVPVPLHPLRLLKRGYNQSEKLSQGMARSLGVPVNTRYLYRKRYNTSQTRHSRKDRWKNTEGIFVVRDPNRLMGRHLLLVDDVMTTGATLVSCIETIRAASPDVTVSVATLATTAADALG